jgi:hypothetical protein
MTSPYSNDRLNVHVNLPLTVDFASIEGITKVIQVLPDNIEFNNWYIVYCNPEDLEKVKTALDSHSGVFMCEKCPIRTHC